MATTKIVERDVRRDVGVTAKAVLLLMVTAVLITGCSALASTPQAPVEEERQPFSARRESEDGAIVEWGGYTEGYEPGGEATFDVSIKNETGQAWPGRFCLQLMGQGPTVLATLEQRPFNLEPGLGFSDTLTVEFPEGMNEGAYGLSLVVRTPNGPTVDLIPITVGETDEERGPTSQKDMDAALEACPEVSGARWEAENLVTLAKEDLAERAGVSFDEIVVQDVKEVEFPDASLGVPEPGESYAQVITPGFVIRLEAGGESYTYHAAGERVVLAIEE
jgi:hypothetical protein